MPHKGYRQTETHRSKISARAKLRGNNGWLGRKHRLDAIQKMRRPKSIEHKRHMSEASRRRWDKGKVGWLIGPKVKPEPVPPQVYHDIFMDVDSSWDGIIDKL